MKKLIAGLVVMLTTFSVMPAMATTGANLTSQAEHILWQILASEGVQNKHHSEVQCLAENIYFEARAESFSGKAAVGNVTRNRVLDKRWPSTYCDVVTQGPVRESWKTKQHKDLKDSERVYYPKKHRCQFSWYCDGQADVIWANYEKTGQTIKGNARAWSESVLVAVYILEVGTMSIKDNTNGAVYYYAHNLVYPSWADKKTFIGTLGNHTFMK
jgi:spore germination cell wall hydrolase CwlJ-like protein